jgi:hypothetical protein
MRTDASHRASILEGRAIFHALRHTFISNLAAGGVHPKTAQRLAQHSTITLTMDRCTHLRREDLAGALQTLPDLSSKRRSCRSDGNGRKGNSLVTQLATKWRNHRTDGAIWWNQNGCCTIARINRK